MARKKTRITQEYLFTVLYEPVREGGYQVTVPLLPGLVTYGRNFDEARNMAQDAIQCYLAALKKDHQHVPSESSFVQERLAVTA